MICMPIPTAHSNNRKALCQLYWLSVQGQKEDSVYPYLEEINFPVLPSPKPENEALNWHEPSHDMKEGWQPKYKQKLVGTKLEFKKDYSVETAGTKVDTLTSTADLPLFIYLFN